MYVAQKYQSEATTGTFRLMDAAEADRPSIVADLVIFSGCDFSAGSGPTGQTLLDYADRDCDSFCC